MAKRNFPAAFLGGYRAYVLGEKTPIYNKHRAPVDYKGGYDAPSEMSDIDKKLWQAGVKYAINERKKCLAIQRNTLLQYNKKTRCPISIKNTPKSKTIIINNDIIFLFKNTPEKTAKIGQFSELNCVNFA